MTDPTAYTVLTTRAPTDIWRKPPALDVANAPHTSRKLSTESFHRARVTVSASWTRLYDQGGLYIVFHDAAPSIGKQCWVKTGVEFYNDRPNVSTVSAREWADWSLLPLQESQTKVTIEVEREPIDKEKGSGSSLWVYLVGLDETGKETRTALREITWAFEHEGSLDIGVYAARPTAGDEEEELKVTFYDFEVV